MLSTRLNSQTKPSLILVIDEQPSHSSLGFQFACVYACEIVNKFHNIEVILTEHDETNWLPAHVFKSRPEMESKMHVRNVFDKAHLTKPLEDCLTLPVIEDKRLIIIESLPWLLLRMSEGNLIRLLNDWSKSNVVIAVLPLDCLENDSTLVNLISIAYISIRIKHLRISDTIEARIEQRSRTSVDTIKSNLTFSIDAQLNAINVHEEKMSNRKPKSTGSADASSKTDVTANLTFNLRLKDDEITARNNLVLPYTKQQQQQRSQTSDDGFTIHYSYDKQDDIDEDEDEDLTL